MLRVRYSFFAVLLLCAGLFSCAIEDRIAAPDEQEETFEQGFSFGTRADASGDPEHADTYTIISYIKGGATTTAVAREQITSTNSRGYYAYDANGDYGTVGALIPVAVSTSTYKTTLDGSGKLQASYGANALHLVPVPDGTNANNTGYYYTAIIHPAIPMVNSNTMGLLARFNRTDEVWASAPDDMNGDGVKGDYFEMEVRNNRQVHDASGVRLTPLTAGIRIYFYSHFYEDNDTSTPVKSVNFNVNEVQLVNAGANGWYNARTGTVYPNYNYTNKDSYSPSLSTNDSYPNSETLPAAVANADAITTSDGVSGNAMWLLDTQRIFPADYRGAEGGGSDYVIPMTLSLKLEESGGAFNNAMVPVAINVERNKCYTFYVNVKSSQIVIDYSVGPYIDEGWTNVGDDGQIGGGVIDYLTIDLENTYSGWDPVNGGSTQIGG